MYTPIFINLSIKIIKQHKLISDYTAIYKHNIHHYYLIT